MSDPSGGSDLLEQARTPSPAEVINDYIGDEIRRVWLARERVCKEAWGLTHPDFRERLTIFEQWRPLGFMPDWSIGCRLA